MEEEENLEIWVRILEANVLNLESVFIKADLIIYKQTNKQIHIRYILLSF